MFSRQSLPWLVRAGGVVLLFAFAGMAFAESAVVEGMVKWKDGAPLAGAVIRFERTDSTGAYTVKSDKKGHFGHYGLPTGVFDVTCSTDGVVVSTVHGFHTVGGATKIINFDLRHVDAKPEATKPAAAPVGALHGDPRVSATLRQIAA
jgi:hypothetical protein